MDGAALNIHERMAELLAGRQAISAPFAENASAGGDYRTLEHSSAVRHRMIDVDQDDAALGIGEAEDQDL